MADYRSYKKITGSQLPDESITSDMVADQSGNRYRVQWVFNAKGACCNACTRDCCCQACGQCCLWTVPDQAKNVVFEIWSGGGGGGGITCCNCCSFSIGGAGGNYAIKSIESAPGCEYTVCAGGAYPCDRRTECVGGMGCKSYVNGFNLSNFCVVGGCSGWAAQCDAWGPRTLQTCANCNICGIFGADFGVMGTTGFKIGHMGCHCQGADGSFSGQAPFIGKKIGNNATESWCSCGCYTNWPSGGSMSGNSSYCGTAEKCCAQGQGQGGSGLVKITFA